MLEGREKGGREGAVGEETRRAEPKGEKGPRQVRQFCREAFF